MSMNRHSMDRVKNNYGNHLLEFCKFNNMFIINGRIGRNIDGKLTSKNAAVVDYFIGTVDFCNIVIDCDVLEFCSLFSDIHCPLEIYVDLKKGDKNLKSKDGGKSDEEKIRKYEREKLNEFRTNLDTARFQDLENILETVDTQDICQTQVNDIVDSISDLFVQAAKATFGTFQVRKHNSDTCNLENNKPWFNPECRSARKKL